MLRLSSRQGFSELSLGSIDKTRVGKRTLTFPVLQDTTRQGYKPAFTFWQLGASETTSASCPLVLGADGCSIFPRLAERQREGGANHSCHIHS